MGNSENRIESIQAYVVHGGGGDYHDQNDDHWILKQIATPMSIYPEYKKSRASFGINALKTVVVEIKSKTGETGFGISTGGYPAAWIIMNHLDRFVIGKSPFEIEKIWDQMYRGTLYYGRKGLVLNAISAIDLALWDLLGKIRNEPVFQMIGGKVRDELSFYATGPRPDIARTLGFIAGKIPLVYGPADGEAGLRKNIELATEMRNRVGDDFPLMWDCWMSLDLPYAKKLLEESDKLGFKWLEECFNPDDYWSYKELKKSAGNSILITAGEHEATRYGFRMLLEMCDLDIVQPDVGWCGGLTELIKIGNQAEACGKLVIPHGSSIYSHHYVVTKINAPYSEYLMTAPDADKVIPQYYPLIDDEPVPENGHLVIGDKPGFGVSLNKEKLLAVAKK